jgi:hypothetical protein
MNDLETLVRKLSVLSNTKATEEFARFYISARFKLPKVEFLACFCDGSNDGGMDFVYREDDTFYIMQSKFSTSATKTSENEVLAELKKLENAITGNNPNNKAGSFVNDLRSCLSSDSAALEYIWLTTKRVPANIASLGQSKLEGVAKKNSWSINTDFVQVDIDSLRAVIYDIKHGNIPYTGKRILSLDDEQFIEGKDPETGVYSVICTIKVVDILAWFKTKEKIETFLQKNVRGFTGDNEINKGIVRSFIDPKQSPWFWYKHNGIIVFADNVAISKSKDQLILRNPQIVNGGQTVRSLFTAWDNQGRPDNESKVVLRAYRLPYESSEAYETGLSIISALNAQNPIYFSDLRSSDPRQVRIEELMGSLDYTYHRKRAKENKATRFSITMKNLALLYYIAKKRAPHIGVAGEIETIFKDKSKYDEVFNEKEINKDLDRNHVVLKYMSVWAIDQIIRRVSLPNRDEEFRAYTRFYVLVDFFDRLENWRKANLNHRGIGVNEWRTFIDSDEFKSALQKYAREAFKEAREMIPKRQEARSFFRTPTASEKFLGKYSQRQFKRLISKAWEKVFDAET